MFPALPEKDNTGSLVPLWGSATPDSLPTITHRVDRNKEELEEDVTHG